MSQASIESAPFSASYGERDWCLLDDPAEWPQFGQRSSQQANCWESSVVIDGMHCASCALTIESLLLNTPGVLAADVSSASRRARVVWSADQTSPSLWMRAMARAGYHPMPANDRHTQTHRQTEARSMLWRWLVAGLCMMQVMMYAYPTYVAAPDDMAPDSLQLLRWASWVLTLPVLLFSCRPFFEQAWRSVLMRRISMDLPVAIGIIVMFIVSSAGTFEPQGRLGREVYFDSLTMFVFFLLTGRWLELQLRDRTACSLEALLNRLPDAVARQEPDGSFVRVAARLLREGDVIQVLVGETFVADGVLLSGSTQVDESMLTGESRALGRGVGETVFAGSHNLAATVRVRVLQLGGQTRVGQMIALMERAATTRPGVVRLADRLAPAFLLGVLVMAFAAAVVGWQQDPGHALMVAAAVLVVTCPCALSLATPTALLAAAGNLARQGILVRRLEAIEAMASVDTVVFDKTGTLTRDTMKLTHVRTRKGLNVSQARSMAAALASHSSHPLSRALAESCGEQDWVSLDVQEVAGQGIKAYLLPMQSVSEHAEGQRVRLGSPRFCGVTAEVNSNEGPQVCLSDAEGWVATFEFSEEIRADAIEAAQQLRQQAVNLAIFSGDQQKAVDRVGQMLNIPEARGACSPQDKLVLLQDMQCQQHRVAMVGDGLNDGPILAAAHVSLAFGQAVPLAQARSDIVVMGERLLAVPQVLHLAKRSMRVVKQNLAWSLIYNLVCVPLAVLGWLPAWLAGLGMALSSLIVVMNSLRLARTSV